MRATVLLCLLLAPEIATAQTTEAQKPEAIDPSYLPRTTASGSFSPAPMLPREIYQAEEARTAETFDKLKANGAREVRAVSSIPNSDNVRRADAVRVLNDAKRAVDAQFEDPEVARGFDAVQVPARQDIPRSWLSTLVEDVFGIARNNADDRRINLHVVSQPSGATFSLCLQFQPNTCKGTIQTPGEYPGIDRGYYKYTVTLADKNGGDNLDLVHFGQKHLECTLDRSGRPHCTGR